MNEVVNVKNVLLLLVKLIAPTIEESNSTKTTINSNITAFNTGKKYRIRITLTEITKEPHAKP